ncbi:hypothetical protein Golob_019724 [Gossypium lobatum]|uniref:RNase H type-1 domain-containing protein n=1 Tax=Gossypium lobatum TaxID=34289 RepID=A0A7J8L878_9ROSI|nr:hypothetical protein [Gossypium lobatum]
MEPSEARRGHWLSVTTTIIPVVVEERLMVAEARISGGTRMDSWGPQPNTLVLMKYWSLPEQGWIKVNTDGAMPFNDDNASIGRVFRDLDGKWLYGYSMRMDKETIFCIEARAILEGLHIAWQKVYR